MNRGHAPPGRYFLDPFGCVKNQVDAETMMALLGRSGWSAVEDPAQADLIIVNSCGFIESAKRESINAVLAWRNRYPEKKILLAGCLAQRYAGELAHSLPEADALFGNSDLGGIAAAAAALVSAPSVSSVSALAQAESKGGEPPPSLHKNAGNRKGGLGDRPQAPQRRGRDVFIPLPPPGGGQSRGAAAGPLSGPPAAAGADPLRSPLAAADPAAAGAAGMGGAGAGAAASGAAGPLPGLPAPGARPLLSLPGSAYVKISEGCDNRCSFCSIPLIRGSLRSRTIPGVLDECRALLDRGIRELCVIGQDSASFGNDRPGGGLPALLEAVAALPGHFWVRLLYLHPDKIPLSIMDIMAGDRRFLPYFDIPFQHAAGPLLKAMNRRGDGERYLELIRKIRGALPGAVIRSTFLVGFPGETEGDFARLLDFQEQAGLDWAGCFTYSREEGTPAYGMGKRVPRRIAAERKRILEERQQGISEGRMERFVGGDYEVLVEEAFEAPEEDDDPGTPAVPPGAAGLYLGRIYCQAPEVDGASLIFSEKPLIPGSLVRGRVRSRTGFDLAVQVISG